MRNLMKILVLGDLHGQIPKIHFKKFDAIICTGDVCASKYILKYFRISYKQFLLNPINYQSWYDITGKSKAKKLVKKSLLAGRRVLMSLNALNVPVYLIPGNWDFVNDGEEDEWKYLNKNYYKEYLIKELKNIHDCHEKSVMIKDGQSKYAVIGYGLVNGPELLKYRHYDNISKSKYKKNFNNYNKLMVKYNKLFRKAKSRQNPLLFLSHNVPFNTKLDRIVNKESVMNGFHYGSNLARDMILKHKPLLCISGHMHEHYGTCRLGRTTILNAGFGKNNNTLIELQDGKIKSIKLHGKKK